VSGARLSAEIGVFLPPEAEHPLRQLLGLAPPGVIPVQQHAGARKLSM
jgi:hypothetical protein